MPKSTFRTILTQCLLTFCVAGTLLLTSCEKELSFKTETFEKKASISCQDSCPKVILKIPVAHDGGSVSDSINSRVFAVMKEIIYFGEKPYAATNYPDLASAFITSYEQLRRENPQDQFGWGGEVTGKVIHRSNNLIGIELDHYTFTGGNHGFAGKRSLLFEAETGKSLSNEDLFSDLEGFRKLAEQKFRQQFQIKEGMPISSDGFLFETGSFTLPEAVFVTKSGVLLFYNPYEIASYAMGPIQLQIPLSEAKPYLAFQ